MFKNLFVYQFQRDADAGSTNYGKLEALRFTPCGPNTAKSSGWASLRDGDEHGGLIEFFPSGGFMRAVIEKKSVPADVVNRRVKEVIEQIELNQGRKPGRKESKEIREAVFAELLPAAFPRRTHCYVWIDSVRKRLVLDASSQAVADEVATMLVQSFDGMSISMIDTKLPPKAVMTWLVDADNVPGEFAVGRGVELRADDESKAVVKFANHNLEPDAMRAHIAQGKLPTRLDLEWKDRVSFVLTEGMQLKKVQLLDVVVADHGDDFESGFDADITILAGELGPMIDDLIDAHGGVLA